MTTQAEQPACHDYDPSIKSSLMTIADYLIELNAIILRPIGTADECRARATELRDLGERAAGVMTSAHVSELKADIEYLEARASTRGGA